MPSSPRAGSAPGPCACRSAWRTPKTSSPTFGRPPDPTDGGDPDGHSVGRYAWTARRPAQGVAMTSLLDVWRAVDPEARQVSGSIERLQRPVRGTAATRAAPPHLPQVDDGQFLVADAALVADAPLDDLTHALADAGMSP